MFEFRHLTPDQLAANESFRKWILSGNQSEGDFWIDWIAANPDKKELVEKAARLLDFEEQVFNRISEGEVEEELNRLSQSLLQDENSSVFKGHFRWYFAAAATLLLIVSGWFIFESGPRFKNKGFGEQASAVLSDEVVYQLNQADEPRLIYLSDGSTVLLQPGSQLICPKEFSELKREVKLKGDAFFEVAKDVKKPFFVYAGTLVTKVLGTSFEVSTYGRERNVKVSVKTGRVSVFPLSGASGIRNPKEDISKEGMIVTPNQQIVYLGDQAKLTRSLVDVPEVLEKVTTLSSRFAFRRTPVGEVFASLSDGYGVEIIFDQEAMKSCFLTAEFGDEPLFEKVNLICKTIGADFEQIDGAIVINSRGCN